MQHQGSDVFLYNEPIKTQYLSRYRNYDTKEVYGRIFKKSASLERRNQQDLYDFTEDQLKCFVIDVLKPKTRESSRSIYSTISSYIDWAMQEGLSSHSENPWKKRNTDYIYDLVIPVKNYMSYEEKQFILDKLVNAQDKFIIEALWNGIQGDKLNELVSLRIEDVHSPTNSIAIANEHNERKRHIIAFDAQLCALAHAANEQRVYIKRNGQCSENTISDSADLVESGFIIKHSNTKHRGRLTHTTHYTIYNRVEMLRSLPELAQFNKVLVTKNIVRSGMIYYAMQLYIRDGELRRAQLEEICERFNIRFKWSIKDFLNLEVLRSLYPEQPEFAH
ncbi:hypothetical protein J40TS1_41650 [Paenibacillus montaniterrae]|uniref:Core-binding (CB) domain-containing protein n=1 Tax=Paenibacillus montaniterrae TaxID=429341 RepID=A0A919YR28_9BACL|nr:hypothetical protein [Paenibacillus montaniterrae]GIP18523.1 hypothetical protein J40TS1_41650 [Paenibacillus montaniterrae]